MNKINSVSPQFRARTVINNPDNLLAKCDVHSLQKFGEQIGLNHDTISFSIRKMNNIARIAYNANFSNPINELKISNIKDTPLNSNYLSFIQDTLSYMRKLYQNTIGV